jgi:UDP-GlcNAc:undecaprenyl-phosphate/decaprenyl-phosphate GlcNAc-1-phosphate transferase
MTTKAFLFQLLFACFLFLISVFLTRTILHRFKILDIPNERSSHDSPIPKCGGISIIVSFFIGIIAIYLFSRTILFNKWNFLGISISTLLIAGISFYDDIKGKSYTVKLFAQFLATAAIITFGMTVNQFNIPFIGNYNIGWLAYPVTFVWIVGLTNAFNFMDGLDGLAGGVTVIVSTFFCIITYYQGSHFVYVICYTLIAGTLGFMVYNFPPARIFMGDVGSTFLGFMFAILAIIGMRYDLSHTSFFVMPLLLFNFIYDTFFTFLRRLFKREKVFHAHRTHLYQLFQGLGYSHLTVSLFHYGVCILQGFAAFFMVKYSGEERTLIYLPFLVFQVIYTIVIIRAAKRKDLI